MKNPRLGLFYVVATDLAVWAAAYILAEAYDQNRLW